MIEQLKPLVGNLCSFAQKRLNFSRPPRLFLKKDLDNSQKMFGKTAFYDPNNESITLFITARHPKDILRSFSHELVHHTQNLRGDLSPEKCGHMDKNYAQNNKHMRNMEKEAYLEGNMCFRDWEDGLHDKEKILIKIAENKFLKENKQMSVKINKKFLKETIVKLLNKKLLNEEDSKEAKEIERLKEKVKELEERLESAKDGYDGRKDTSSPQGRRVSALTRQLDKTKKELASLKNNSSKPGPESEDASQETQSESKGAFAPSHYCIHHGGVQHEGAIYQGEAIGHNWNEELGKVTHYDMKLADGTILEDVAAEDILVTKASLAEGSYTLVGECSHKRHGIKRKKDKEDLEENEELEEISTKELAAAAGDPDEVESKDFEVAFGKKKKGRQEESKIQTPEQEETLYEQRFTKKNTKLFERLLKEWTK